MKAAQFNQYGDTSVIEINDNALDLKPSSDQILVEVFAVSINPVESAIRNGYMQQMLTLSFPVNLGGDFSGIVKEIGENVTNFKIGDEVFGIANPFKGGTGSVAQYVCANSNNSGNKPKKIDHSNASSLPLVGSSALQAIEEHIELKKDQKILIHGGAGGIGALAIQLAKSKEAYVATTVSTDSIEFAKNLGADLVIDYKNQDFTTLINDFDAVFDTVGGETTNLSIKVLKNSGILVSMAGQPDQELAKKQNVTAITQMTKGDTKTLNKLSELIDSDKIKPIIDSTFTLDQTKEAYDLLENGHPKGKIVIKIK